MTGNRCAFPVLDALKRAKGCGKPATGVRMVYGTELDTCDACAVVIDATPDKPMARQEAPAPKPPKRRRAKGGAP